MIKCLGLMMALGASACSQYSVNDKGYFVMERLPQKGEDFSAILQANLDYLFDPRRRSNLPGYIRFKVTKAVVYASDPFVPRPDTASSVVRFHCHIVATLPSGQQLDEDSVEMMDGIWIRNKFLFVDFGDQVLPYDVLGKDSTESIYADLSKSNPSTDASAVASVIHLLCDIPIPASGSIDLHNWQRIHDLALTRHDLLKDQP